ncbi:ABC transporter ATP-binding protein [Lapidilactobacillus wuchangensis]|uniref:ABC transporter ATP-binding protein n=1 Tax=Lapidilactobacillus wuchangensis TaxID=2486001 RepID=UPI000F775163|nr:ABC transporter ATP-binding protein [Lapidilactobacillus wuchangensis]
MELLRVSKLSKVYGSGSAQVTALADVSFTVDQGEFVAIVGASGSGKSTLLHLIGGVDRPTEGAVFLDGQNIFSFSDDQLAIFRRREVGLIYQFYNLIPILNVTENITLPLELDNRQADPEKLAALLKRLGLTNRREHLPNELSGGQQQRVSIGRALITEPALLLADEPTGNLDSATSAEILALLKQANREYKQTIVMITHDLEIARQADRVIEIEDGRIIREAK